MWDDDRRPGDEPWHDNQSVILASGVGALALVGLLVFAVMRVSDNSVESPNVGYDTSVAGTTSFTTPSSTTSYTTPSVQTSEFTPEPAQPPDPPSNDGPGDQSEPPAAPTTIYNPYAPPTSQGSAGHI